MKYSAPLTHQLLNSGIRIEIDGGTEWLLTTNLAFAQQQLADIGCKEVAVVNLATVINEQYCGLATLTQLG